MRMANERSISGARIAFIEQSFELSGRSCKEKCLDASHGRYCKWRQNRAVTMQIRKNQRLREVPNFSRASFARCFQEAVGTLQMLRAHTPPVLQATAPHASKACAQDSRVP